MPDLPPWSGDDEAMYQWCVAMIKAQWEEERANFSGPIVGPVKYREMIAIAHARVGDLWLLRRIYPQLAEFLHPPKLPRGKHDRRAPQFVAHKAQALDTVKRVKALWRKHYRRRKRGRYDGITAIEIAARYCHEDPERVARWVRTEASP